MKYCFTLYEYLIAIQNILSELLSVNYYIYRYSILTINVTNLNKYFKKTIEIGKVIDI